LRDDPSALRAAILEGVTKNTETNRGNGLYGTFKCCEVSGGSFSIMSGNVNLNYRPGELTVTTDRIPFAGTVVRACINYNYDKLLEKALVFGGKPHEPAFDYIDRSYQSDTEHIYFQMNNEVDSFGSRDAGRMARTKIANLMNRATLPIEFDFSEVPLISSSFADEVFGKLFLELGALRFTALCKFKNVDRTVQLLIDRAIAQRLQF
jgi:STAS-like domain of unknown function (DUF4325)